MFSLFALQSVKDGVQVSTKNRGTSNANGKSIAARVLNAVRITSSC